MGGEVKQYQVLTSPERMSQHDVTLNELTEAVEKSNVVTGGGFLLSQTHESLIRIIGRATTLDEVNCEFRVTNNTKTLRHQGTKALSFLQDRSGRPAVDGYGGVGRPAPESRESRIERRHQVSSLSDSNSEVRMVNSELRIVNGEW